MKKDNKMAKINLEKQLEFPFMKQLRNEEKERNFEEKSLLYTTLGTIGLALSTNVVLDYFNTPQVYDIVQKFIGN